jgi:GntR family transcriptional regulator
VISPALDRGEASLTLQVAEALGRAIAAGDFGPGDALPSERRLAEEFGVSRMTVRSALRVLQARGMLAMEPGRRSFVPHQKLDAPLDRRWSFTEGMRARGFVPSSRVLETRTVAASLDLARVFDIPPGSPLVQISRVRCLGGNPVGWEVAYLPCVYFPALETHDFGQKSLYATLDELYGAWPTKVRQTVEAVLPTEEECALLEATASTPVLRVVSTAALPDDRVIEHARGVWRGDRYLLTVEKGRDTESSSSRWRARPDRDDAR